MNILFCQPTLDRSGSEHSLVDIVEGLAATGRDTLHLLAGRDGPMGAELKKSVSSLTIVDAPKLSRNARVIPRWLRSFSTVYGAVRGLGRTHGITLVYVNTSMFPQALVAAALCRIPCIVHVREVETTYPSRYYRSMTGLAARFASRIVCVCEFIRAQGAQGGLGRRDEFVRKSVVVHNASPFEVGPLERSLSSPLRILAVIPVTRRKGIEDLVACTERLAGGLGANAIHVDVVGAIPDETLHREVAGRIARAGLSASITFHGEQRDVAPFYRDAHILLHPSHSEAFPRVVIEAASFSLPVVATRAGGTEEAIVEGETGFLVPIGDSRAMADRVLALASSQERYRGIANAAYRHSRQEFTRGALVARLERVLDPFRPNH